MAVERSGAVTLNGQPMSLIGPELKPGERAPDFNLVDADMKIRSIGEFKGKIKLISAVTSLDTEICSMQTKKFDDEVAKLGDKIEVITVSMDLPSAQGRFCKSNSVKHTVLSDHRDAKFGLSYGTLIKDIRLLSRAVFVVNADGIVTHAEYVKEVASHPDYAKALEAIKAATQMQ